MDKPPVKRVWIEPGCIVCDACQSTCPQVFEVRAETCIVKPEALDPSLLRDLGEQVRLAALECPVEVIRYEQDSAPPA